MDISANWRLILDEMDAPEPDYDYLRVLLEAGLRWFAKDGFTPDSLPVSRKNCQRIYAALLDRFGDI